MLAIARPDLRVTLIEPLLRRTRFLDEAVAELGLADQVEVLRGRAEEVAGERTFDVVTARAVAPLERLARWCLPLVAPHGELIAMKGASAEAEVAAAAAALRALGCAPRWWWSSAVGVLAESTWAVRLARPESGPVGWRGRPGRGGRRARERRRTA